MTGEHAQWSSRLAFLMAAVGCAVGMGNIWLFPYMAGSQGGGAFVLIYLAAMIGLALPVLLSELMMGRRGQAAPPQGLARIARESGRTENWRWVGILFGALGAILALGFYCVVGGWTLAYAFKAVTGALQQLDAESSKAVFNTMNGSPQGILPAFILFAFLTIFISSRGLKDGIERAVKFIMPALFVMLVGLVFYAAFVGDFGRAIEFLFAPDFSKVTGTVALGAIGTAFFSVSVGITNMMAYGSYISKDTNLPQSASIIVGADTFVALMAGLAIFPIVFMAGIEPGGGPGLVFEAFPIAFGSIPGGLIVGTVFFVLLFFAALTSSIGMMEPPVSWLQDQFKWSRQRAALTAGTVAFLLALSAALSLNIWSDVRPLGEVGVFAGKEIFSLFIYLVTQVIMPAGGIFVAFFVGWMIKKQYSADELYDGQEPPQFKLWLFIMRFVAPVLLTLVLYDVAVLQA
ncbi:MAG: sodium-dependent transporter [Pseudomonadota bacterium]